MKKRLIILTCLSAILLGGLFLLKTPVHSQTKSLQDEISAQNAQFAQGANFRPPRDPRLIIAQIIKALLSIIGTVFTLYIVYGGFLIMNSRGEEENITKGKKIIVNGVIGIIVSLTAYSIAIMTYSIVRRGFMNPFSDWSYWGVTEDTSGFYNTDPLEQDTVPFRSY